MIVPMIVSLALIAGAGAGTESLAAGAVPWTTLDFSATKLGMTAHSEIRFEKLQGAAADADLVAVPNGRSASGAAVRLGVRSTFRRRDSRIDLWLDAKTGMALQRRKLETGRKHYQRTERYALDRVHSLRREPASAEETSLGPAGWSEREDTEIPFERDHGETLSEPLALFYLVSASDLREVGARLESVVYSKKQLVALTLEVTGITEVPVAYDEMQGGRATRHEGTIDALCIAVSARPLGPDGDRDDFRFLGLRGDIEMFVDPRNGLPVRISGRTEISLLGRLDVDLVRAEMGSGVSSSR